MAKKASEKAVAEEVKAVAAPVETVKAEKKAAKKTAEKTEKVAKKAEKKTEEKAETVFVQYAGKEITVDEIKDRAKAAYEAEGHRASSIKSLRLYVKPEENKAYYVINEKAAGSIEL